MAEVTRLDEDNVGIILSNEEASILHRIIEHNIAASIVRDMDLWNEMAKFGIKYCKEEFYGIVTRR